METPQAQEAFEEIYRLYAGDVLRFSVYLSGNWALAQDLAAETFVRAWTAPAPVKVATAKAYLFAIARNLHLDSKRRTRPEGQPLEPVAAPGNFAADYEHRTQLEQTLRDLATIAEGDRAALILVVFEEVSYEEAARVLGIGISAVKARIFRARLRLAELREQRNQRSQA